MKAWTPGQPRDCVARMGVVYGPAAAMMAVTVAAAAVSAAGAIQQGQAQKSMSDYNAAVEAQDAKQASDAAEANAQRSETRATQLLGQQKAAFAAGGVDPNAGSPLDVMSDTSAQTKLDAMTIRYGGTVAAQRATSQAGLDTMQGNQAVTGSYYAAGSSLLGGAARAYGYSQGGGSTPFTGTGYNPY